METKQKLYTEEQVRNAIDFFLSDESKKDKIIEALTPIDLPSDEEIGKDIGSGMHDFYKGGFIEGAKWMREELTKL